MIERNNSPGPGTYETTCAIDKMDQKISNFKSVAVRKFGTSVRPNLSKYDTQTPGPGHYRPPSDFGYLEP